MSDYDLFEMTGLAFDPPETNVKLIRERIEKKRKELGNQLGRETQQVSRDRIRGRIAYLDGVCKTIFTADGKKLESKAFISLAQDKQIKVQNTLKSTLDLMVVTGTHTLTEMSVRYYRKETGLSADSIRKTMKSAGIIITKHDPLKSYPKFPVNAERMSQELEAMRTHHAAGPDSREIQEIRDLYCLAAYFSSDSVNVRAYRGMDRGTLNHIFDQASRKYSMRNDDLGKLCGSLASSAKTYVFNSDENRSAYDAYLLYHSEELTGLFSKMKRVPESILLESRFADPCIDIISKYFPDYKTALAIYNKEAGFRDSCYTPVNSVYTVKCSYCGQVTKFDSEQTAQSSNRCSNCGRELFRKCGSCKAMIPAFMDKCPHCHTAFVSPALFSKYYKMAESAIKEGDYTAARENLRMAQSASPDNPSVDRLEAQIVRLEREEREPVEKIKKLMAEHRYQEADAELAKVIKLHPKINVRKYEAKIETELDAADDMYSANAHRTVSERADVCVEILTRCADHKRSLDFLRANPPKPCMTVSAVSDSEAGTVSISWTAPRERGVTYTLLRNESLKSSASTGDGTVVARGITGTSFTDRSVKNGSHYTYTIFSCRYGSESTPAWCRVSIAARTYRSVAINRTETDMNEVPIPGREGRYSIDINIRMDGSIPESAAGFYYTARTGTSSRKWATAEEIGRSPDIRRISADEYRNLGAMICRMSVRSESCFYITVFTIYRNGSREEVSEPSKTRICRSLSADLFWDVRWKYGDGLKLSIEMEGNRPVDHVPELVLCACDENNYILSADDRNSYKLAYLPEVDLDDPKKKYTDVIDIKTQFTLKQLKKYRFFLYIRNSDKCEKIALRWRKGFSGKV